MEVANNTFISSTMFTERIGFVAALKTIEILCENKVWDHLINIGSIIGESWLNIAMFNQDSPIILPMFIR